MLQPRALGALADQQLSLFDTIPEELVVVADDRRYHLRHPQPPRVRSIASAIAQMGQGPQMVAVESGIHIERDGDVVILVIDRPEVRNALDPTALLTLAQAVDDATADPGVSAAVLTHTGDLSFSSGMDLRA